MNDTPSPVFFKQSGARTPCLSSGDWAFRARCIPQPSSRDDLTADGAPRGWILCSHRITGWGLRLGLTLTLLAVAPDVCRGLSGTASALPRVCRCLACGPTVTLSLHQSPSSASSHLRLGLTLRRGLSASCFPPVPPPSRSPCLLPSTETRAPGLGRCVRLGEAL